MRGRVGRRLAALVGVVVAATSGVTPPLAAAPRPCGVGGALAVMTSHYDIDVVDVATHEQRRLVDSRFEALLDPSLATEPSWSPDGTRLAYGRAAGIVPIANEVRIVTADGRNDAVVVALPPLVAQVTEVAWSPDGRRLAFVALTRNYPVETATWSTLGDRASLFVVDVDGTGLRLLATPPAALIDELAWAPDGRHLAFSDFHGAGSVDVVDVDAVVPVARPVTPLAHSASGPRWSPDGRLLAYRANRPAVSLPSPRPEVWVVERDGTHPRALPLRTWDDVAWSPDGRWVAAGRSPGGIAAVSIDGRKTVTLTDGADDASPAWSPDGSRVAFMRQVPFAATRTLHLLDLDDGRVERISATESSRAPRWCPVR